MRLVSALMVFVLLVCGYMHFRYNSFASDITRVNDAVPLSFDTQQMLGRMTKRNAGKLPNDLQADFKERMEDRVHKCANAQPVVHTLGGYTTTETPKALIKIGLFTSQSDIQRAVGDSKCFAETDAEIGSWLGLQLLALYLADPPLRPLPSKPLADIPFKAAQPDSVYTASRAGVMLLQSVDAIEVVDTATGDVVRKSDMPESGHTEGLSPNGRIYAVTHEDRIDFKDTVSGEFLASSRSCQFDDCGFQWVDARSFLTYGDARRASSIHDLRNGHAGTFPATSDPIMALSELPNAPNTFLALTNTSALRVKFIYFRETPAITADSTRQIAQPFDRTDRGGLNADGTLYVHSSGTTMFVTNATTLETQVVQLDPFAIKRSLLTADPNQVLLVGSMKATPELTALYLYNISSQTFAAVDPNQYPPNAFVYLKGVSKLARVTDDGVHIVDSIAAEPPITLAAFHALEQSSLSAKQEDTARNHQIEQKDLKNTQVADLSAPSSITLAPGSVFTHADITALAGDATVEGAGVLHGLGAGPGASTTVTNTTTTQFINGHVITLPHQQIHVNPGTASVRVEIAAGRRIVLVLASAEHVRWDIVAAPGSHIKAIMLSGRGGSEITGQGNTPVVTIGTAAAADTNGPQYDALQTEVSDWTGKRIARFQGSQEAARFYVGG